MKNQHFLRRSTTPTLATWPDGPLPSFVPMPHRKIIFVMGNQLSSTRVPGVERLRSSNLLPTKLAVVQCVTCSDPAWGNYRSISKERERVGIVMV